MSTVKYYYQESQSQQKNLHSACKKHANQK